MLVTHAGQSAGVAVGRTDTDIGRAIEHTLDHPIAGAFFQVDLDLLVAGDKTAQVFGQKLNDRRQVRQHAHITTHALHMLA
ncbi:hypothetical protein D3C87_1652100 [compost metagenome]